MKNNFVIATHNTFKADEIQNILRFYHQWGEIYTDKLPRQHFPSESTTSYQANATKKAIFISQQLPGANVIADDSGLELAAFPAKYGVQTARELAVEVPDGQLNRYLIQLVNGKSRKFTMKTIIALAVNGHISNIARGELTGVIAPEERGTNSTGFDRILIPDGEDQTLAEMSRPKRISYLHRARAVKNLLDQLGEVK